MARREPALEGALEKVAIFFMLLAASDTYACMPLPNLMLTPRETAADWDLGGRSCPLIEDVGGGVMADSESEGPPAESPNLHTSVC